MADKDRYEKAALFYAIAWVFVIGTCTDAEIFFGGFQLFLSPKILKEGIITGIGFGLHYLEQWGGELRLRFTNIAANEELIGVADSIKAQRCQSPFLVSVF
jgi:hypothetical protein